MGTAKTYVGSCHCKNVRFEVTAEIDGANACNCSICSRVGWLMKSVAPSQFKLLSGEAAQNDYQFGSKSMHHLFCTTCGIHAYGTFTHDGQDKVIVNLRCLEGLDVDKLPVETFDGKSY
jgi:hypothetical protein